MVAAKKTCACFLFVDVARKRLRNLIVPHVASLPLVHFHLRDFPRLLAAAAAAPFVNSALGDAWPHCFAWLLLTGPPDDLNDGKASYEINPGAVCLPRLNHAARDG